MKTKKTALINVYESHTILNNPIGMKNTILLCCLLGLQLVNGQNQNKVAAKPLDTLAFAGAKLDYWETFLKKIAISESMETHEQIGEPAQLQFTLPEDKPESYIINLGMSYQFNDPDKKPEDRWVSRVKTEFHKNSLLEKEQENLEVGYQGQWRFSKTEEETKNRLYLIFDPKYVYDGIENKSSVAGNTMLTITSAKSSFFKFNSDNAITDRVNFVPSLFLGAQLQDSFKATDENSEGFILRPVFSGAMALYWNKAKKGDEKTKEGIAKLSAIYTGRKDVINNTANEEGYTSLIKTKAEVFLLNVPIKISIGASFNKGSDPLKGLTKQEYWLLSLNVLK